MPGTVVKVGGSLFDLPDLGPRLRQRLAGLAPHPVLLVAGGGAAADLVRAWDRCHGLGDEAAHWLALQAMTLNGGLLAALVPGSMIVGSVAEWVAAAQRGRPAILDAVAFARDDEGQPGALPASWEVTSDSVAARVAVVAAARELVLLKSIEVSPQIDWSEAARRGWVDRHFPTVVRGQPLVVRAEKFRP
ncbi:MAG: hypothetical protein NZ700_02965 [Gemmataceae bacterium]|nr:hypothetical protein [Gemmataceae bacterium]MDW8266708.1 hypothetical protein [Gemmataceae bacterium]